MCENSSSREKCNCIAEVLKVINILQNEVCPGNDCQDTCTRAFLGPDSSVEFNTRPVTLYTCNGTSVSMPVSNRPDERMNSNIFRVERVDRCCATLRVLIFNCETETYTATNSFFTINTECLCSIKCLEDTFVCV